MLQMKIRVPDDLHRFLQQEAERNASSMNSEVIRSIRERMETVGSARTAILPSHDHQPALNAGTINDQDVR